MPFFKGHLFSNWVDQGLERYLGNVAGIVILSAFFTALPMLLVLLKIGILNSKNLKKGRYATIFLIIQVLMAIITYVVIGGEFGSMDEIFLAGLLISISSILCWSVTFLIRKPTPISRIRDEKLLDEDMEKG